jgi:hypothetical protein
MAISSPFGGCGDRLASRGVARITRSGRCFKGASAARLTAPTISSIEPPFGRQPITLGSRIDAGLPTTALNFSRPEAPVVVQYYNFLRLGFDGYRRVLRRGFSHDMADLLVGDLELQLPRLTSQSAPLHDGVGATGFHH